MNKRVRTLKRALAGLGHQKKSQSTRYLYHGTTADRAKEILARGFDISKGGEKSGAQLPGISASIEEEVAKDHAEWAGKKFGSTPAVVVIDGSNLNLASGKEFHKAWDKMGSFEEAIGWIKSDKEFDGVELWSGEEGIEESEVLIFNVDKIKIVRVETRLDDVESRGE
jgi:hypothetical protein